MCAASMIFLTFLACPEPAVSHRRAADARRKPTLGGTNGVEVPLRAIRLPSASTRISSARGLISSRAFRPAVALGVTALAEFLGPFIFGVAVAKTIAHEIVSPESITIQVLLAALIGAIVWNLLTWFFGIPSSSSHALVGGLIGAVIVGAGFKAIQWNGLEKVLIALFSSPIIGLALGYLFTKVIFFLARGATPKINWFFRRAQIITGIALAFCHGANDAQKTMGVITLGLLITGYLDFYCPILGHRHLRWRDRLGNSIGRMAFDQNFGRQVLQDQARAWLCGAGDFGFGDPGRIPGRRSGQHDPGGQFCHHGRWFGRACEHGALGRGRRDCNSLDRDHPSDSFGCGRSVLADPERPGCAGVVRSATSVSQTLLSLIRGPLKASGVR